MKLKRILGSVLMGVVLMGTPAFADGGSTTQSTSNLLPQAAVSKEDPVQLLKEAYEKVNEAVNYGRITEDTAQNILSSINQQVDTLENFNSWEPADKKYWFAQDLSSWLDTLKKTGVLTSAVTTDLQSRYQEEIDRWDGTGYPEFYLEKTKTFVDSILLSDSNMPDVSSNFLPGTKIVQEHPEQLLTELKSKVQQAAEKGNIAEEDADNLYNEIDMKAAEVENYNSLEPDMKQYWLTQDANDWVETLADTKAIDFSSIGNVTNAYKSATEGWDGTGYPSFYLDKTKAFCDAVSLIIDK